MLCNREPEWERGYLTVLYLLADMRENPRFRRFMPLQAAGSDLSEKELKSLKQKAKKQTVK